MTPQMEFTTITEGRTELYVPRQSVNNKVPPMAPVFFNPAAETNRDVSVAILETGERQTFCDGLAGVGARGLRIAKESSTKTSVTLVDFNRQALRAAERSARLNRIIGKCAIVCSESRTFLDSRFGRDTKFDFVDIDPFGSPAPYLLAMIGATTDGGIVSVTATDTAALCGVYPLVCKRRYASIPLNNHFHHETGARILLNAIRRQAASVESGIEPIAAHSTMHYIRVYARVVNGGRKADEAGKNEGLVGICASCAHAHQSSQPTNCEKCGGKVHWAGPLWVGSITNPNVLRSSTEAAQALNLPKARKILDSLSEVDRFPPWSFEIDGICSKLKIATVSEVDVKRHLADVGFLSGDQPFEKTGLKTTAPYSEVVEAIKRSDES